MQDLVGRVGDRRSPPLSPLSGRPVRRCARAQAAQGWFGTVPRAATHRLEPSPTRPADSTPGLATARLRRSPAPSLTRTPPAPGLEVHLRPDRCSVDRWAPQEQMARGRRREASTSGRPNIATAPVSMDRHTNWRDPPPPSHRGYLSDRDGALRSCVPGNDAAIEGPTSCDRHVSPNCDATQPRMCPRPPVGGQLLVQGVRRRSVVAPSAREATRKPATTITSTTNWVVTAACTLSCWVASTA